MVRWTPLARRLTTSKMLNQKPKNKHKNQKKIKIIKNHKNHDFLLFWFLVFAFFAFLVLSLFLILYFQHHFIPAGKPLQRLTSLTLALNHGFDADGDRTPFCFLCLLCRRMFDCFANLFNTLAEPLGEWLLHIF